MKRIFALSAVLITSFVFVQFAECEDEVVTITKTVEEKINITELKAEIQRVKDFIDYHNSLTEAQKAEIYDREHNIQGWIDELKRQKDRLAELKK